MEKICQGFSPLTVIYVSNILRHWLVSKSVTVLLFIIGKLFIKSDVLWVSIEFFSLCKSGSWGSWTCLSEWSRTQMKRCVSGHVAASCVQAVQSAGTPTPGGGGQCEPGKRALSIPECLWRWWWWCSKVTFALWLSPGGRTGDQERLG